MVGCTANVALVVKDEFIVANVGDTRCLLSSKGKVIEMSEDHKPELEREKKRIEEAGGEVISGRINGNLNISRALGDFPLKNNTALRQEEQMLIAVPEIKKRKLTSDDEFIIILCDGVWECMSNQELIDFVGEKINNISPMSKIVEELFDKIIAPEKGSKFYDIMKCYKSHDH